MCSTPRGSGKSRPAERFHEETDYASYSAMLRRASRCMDRKDRQQEAQRKRDREHEESSQE